jgi:hypothetical protein
MMAVMVIAPPQMKAIRRTAVLPQRLFLSGMSHPRLLAGCVVAAGNASVGSGDCRTGALRMQQGGRGKAPAS